MTAGSHGSLFDPTASPAATVEMQTQAVKFAASAIAARRSVRGHHEPGGGAAVSDSV